MQDTDKNKIVSQIASISLYIQFVILYYLDGILYLK